MAHLLLRYYTIQRRCKIKRTIFRQFGEWSQDDLKEMIKFFGLIKKTTVDGLLDSSNKSPVDLNKK